MSSCGHLFESLRKRCSNCNTEQKKITGKFCSKCGQSENCNIVCPECQDAVPLTKCRHSGSQWQKICAKCGEGWDSLDSAFCCHCPTKGNFIYFCKLCPVEATVSDPRSILTQSQGQSDVFSSVQSVPANNEVTNPKFKVAGLQVAGMCGSIAKNTLPESATYSLTVDQAAIKPRESDMHANLRLVETTEQQRRSPQSMDEQRRGSQSMDEQNRDPHNMDERSRGPQSMDEKNRDPHNMDERSRGSQSMDEKNRDPHNMDERSRGPQNMDEQRRDPHSIDERSRNSQSMDERSKGQQSMDERSKGPQSMDEQRRDPQSMDQRKDEQPTRNTQNPIISSKYHQLTCEHPSKSWSDRRNSNELNLRGSRSQISEQEPYCSQEDRPGERSRSAAKRQLQNEIQRRFPEEKIFPMKVRFHILNESFSFNPENDKVIIVFSHEKLGGGSAAHSPFEIDSTCMALSQWKDSQEKVHKLTEVCYEFFLPQSAFSGKWNAEYEYSVKRKRANGHSYVEESLLHSDSRHQKAGISKRVVSDFTIKFDGIVSGNNLAPVFEKDQHSSEYYRMMLEQLTKCAVRELSERTLSPTTVVPEFEWAMHRLEDSEISTATSIKEQTVRSFVEQVMAAPSKHGFLTTAQKSTEDWKNSLELLRLCVERGGCFSTQMRLLGLRQDRAAQLLQGLLPPLDYASENNGKATRRHDRALKNLFNYVMTTESFFFELLFAIPAYHLLVLKVDPADSDLRRYKFEESRFPQFCGFEENRQVGFFKKNRYDYGRVEHFLAEYSKVDPLLCRFFAAIAHFDYINDFLTLRNVPALVKLATLQSLTSDSKKLKAVSEAAPSVIGSLQESPSGLTDFELKQCLLITRSMRNRVLSVDNVELYLQLVDCMLSCELENLRRGDKKKKEDIKELNESLEKLEESFRARKSSPQPFGYETLESLIRNFNNSFRQINQSDCTENLSKCLQKYFTRLLQYFEKETLLNFFNTSSTFGIMQPCATICLLNSLLETPKKHLENSGSLKTAFEKLFEQSKRTPQIYSVLSGVVCDTAKSFRSSNSNDNDRIDFLPELKFLIEWPIAACLLDFLEREEFNQKMSDDAKAVLDSCQSAASEISRQLSELTSIRFGAVDYLLNSRTQFETLFKQLKIRTDVPTQLNNLNGLKQEADKRIALLNGFVEFVQTSTDTAFVDMEQFKERLSVDSLRNRQIAELAEKPAKNLHMALIRDLVAEDLMSSSISFLERSRDSRTVKEVFNRLVESRYKDSQQKLSLTEILGCLKTAEDDWARYVRALITGNATLADAKRLLGNLLSDDQRENLDTEITIFLQYCSNITESRRTDVIKKLSAAEEMRKFCKVASALQDFSETFSIEITQDEGLFSTAKTLRTQLMDDQPIKEIRPGNLTSRYGLLENLYREPMLADFIEEICESRQFFTWVRENFKEEELNSFLEHAMIELVDSGESEQEKVQLFVSVAKDFASIIYRIPSHSKNLNELINLVKPILDVSRQKPNILQHLKETRARLQFLKDVKENQGSVEKTTLQKIESILTNGVIEIGCLVSFNEPFQLIMPTGDGKKQCELDDIKNLQSKLMLLAGEGCGKRQQLERFVNLMESAFQLVDAYKAFKLHCCVLCEKIAIKVKLMPESETNVSIELRYCNPHKVIKYKYEDIKDGLISLSNIFKDCLDEWLKLIATVRTEHTHLNFFSLQQIKFLQTTLASIFSSAKGIESLDSQTAHLLHFIFPNCDESVVNKSVARVITERAKGSAGSVHDESSIQKIQSALTNEGYDEKTIDQTVQILFRNPEVAAKNIDELIEQATDLAGKVEKDFISQAEKQRESNWKTADQDLIAAQIGNLPAHEAFRKLWKIYLHNIHSSHSDFLSFYDVNLFLSTLASQENSRSRKQKLNDEFAKAFKTGKPVSLSLQSEKHLLAAVYLFKEAFSRLPQMEEVLCCSEHTAEEDLIVFLHRAILDSDPKSLYIIINADKLPNYLSVVAEEQFNRLMNRVNGRIQSHVFVIFGLERKKQFPFCNCLSSYAQEFSTQSLKKNELQKFVEGFLADAENMQNNNFLWISSDRSGMGKSLLCENISAWRGCPKPLVFCCSGAHLSADELYQFFLNSANEDSPVFFHLDIAREVQTGFDSCITQLAIFGAIVNSNGFVWRRKPKDLYLLEHSENKRVASRFQVLNLLPRVNCLTPAQFLEEAMHSLKTFVPTELILFTERIDQYKAIASSMSSAVREGRRESREVLTEASSILRSLISHCGVNGPSWLELINFSRFYQTQFNDMEKSIFCSALVERDLPGFKDFVLRLLLLMSKDFSTRSIIDCSDESGASGADKEESVSDFQLRRHWEQEPHPYLLFNEDGQSFTFFGFTIDKQGNLVDSNTGQVLQKEMIKRQLRDRLVAQQVPINEKFDDLSRAEKISRMRMVFGFAESSDFQDPDKSYELTMDNVKKILAIYMRFRSKIPVVLMGETGCGKTKLVEFLARIIQPKLKSKALRPDNMRVLKVHGGVTLDDIEKAVSDAEKLSEENYEKPIGQRSPYTILFFDEVNTTSFVGLIKEIMLDGRINGRKINFESGLRCVAACNPYRKHPKSTIDRLENSGLGYRVRKEETQDKFGDVPMRHLVYRVKPLPLSLTCVLWDFGNLSEEAEEKYIERMVSSRLEKMISDVEKQKLTTVISAAQKFMRQMNNETKYVSLREVEREIQLFHWILCGDLIRKYQEKYPGDSSLSSFDVSVVISVSICYLSRLPRDKKDPFFKVFKALKISKSPVELTSMIKKFQGTLIHDIRLPRTLAVNDALRENVFMMAISISLRIPLFLVGKPGSSKSISKAIVTSNMLGSNASGKEFRKLPSTDIVSFQCSPWCTSEDIIKVFSECAHKQKNFKDSDFVPVVVLDEIGLAEDSPKMPLKVLHPLLEDGVPVSSEVVDSASHRRCCKVGFVGISNWALDPAKMNRGLYLLRDVPTHEDLIETAKGICKERVEPIGKYLEPLTKFYLKIFCGPNIEREFFGLRDYFSLLKHLLEEAKAKKVIGDKHVAKALLRNFNGLDKFDPVKLYCSTNGPILTDPNDYSPLSDALHSTGPDQRYLLLIAENYSGVKLLKQLLSNVELKIIFGSSFPKDQEYTMVCKTINRIKICMERGSTIVLMNLEALYESLYDVLNLCYEECSGNRFVDLGLGTHRLKSRVNANFRIIVVADDRTVNEKFPIPLINRLEKHKLTSQALMDRQKQEFCAKQRAWAEGFSQGEKLAGVFVGFHEDMIPSLSLEVDASESSFQGRILAVATPDSLLRVNDDNERRRLLQRYFKISGLGCLQSFLEVHNFKTPLLQITTFDRLLNTGELNQLPASIPKLGRVAHKNLNVCETESQFIEILKNSRESNETLILQYEGVGTGYQDLIYCVKHLIEEEIRQNTDCAGSRKIILIIKLVRSLNNSFSGYDCGLWHCVHIEELLPPRRLNVCLLNELKSLSKLFPSSSEEADTLANDDEAISPWELRKPANTKHLLKDTLFTALSLLNDRSGDERRMRRQDCLFSALDDSEFLRKIEPFLQMALQKKEKSDQQNSYKYEPKAWLTKIAASSKNVLEAGTLIESIWRILKQKVAPAFACLLAFLDKDSNLENYVSSDTRDLWLQLLEPASAFDDATDQLMKEQLEVNRVEVFSSASDGHHFSSKFPFSWAVLSHLESLEDAKRSAGPHYVQGIEDSALRKFLAGRGVSRELIESFCHDLLHIKFQSIAESEAAVLQKILMETISDQLSDTLLSAILASIGTAAEFKSQIDLFIKLAKKIHGLVDKLPQITHLRDLAEATFCAFIEIFEQKKLSLNTAMGRSEWIDLFEKSQAIISRLLHRHRKSNMAQRWDKVICVVLFLRNVSAPFDKEKLNESSIKPIRLWNSLLKNPDLSFKKTGGIRLVENFLEDANKNLTEKISGTSTCSKCEKRNDRLTLLPCNDRICGDCLPKSSADDDATSKCPKCKQEFDPAAINSARPEALDKFKARCNFFMLELVSQLCFKSDVPTGNSPEQPHLEVPDEELCRHLLTYVTRNSSEATVFGFFSDDRDPSPVFRSFILQQLLKFNYDEVVNQLSQHIKEAANAMGTESQQELELVILNCLEDLAYFKSAKKDEESRLRGSFLKFSELPTTTEGLDTEFLHRVVEHRIFLSNFAASIVRLPKESPVVSIERNISGIDLYQQVSDILKTHDWSRIFFLRSLSMAGGTCATLERLQTDEFLSDVFATELDPNQGPPPMPDLLQSHSEEYREVKRFLWRSYLSGDKDAQKPGDFDQENCVIALAAVNWENLIHHAPMEVNRNQLQHCLDSIETLMKPETKELAKKLRAVELNSFKGHQIKSLLIHFYFCLLTSKGKSDFTEFLSQLAKHRCDWYLPAMPHDELFEAFNAVRLNERLGAYVCPNGHPYYIGECTRPWDTGTCFDCGSTIGGQRHVSAEGNQKFESMDQTKKDFVPLDSGSTRPEAVRQLSGCSVALLRLLQSLALMKDNHEDSVKEFKTGLRLFTGSTGRSEEDAYHTLHLVLEMQLKKSTEKTGFDLKKDQERRAFENRMYASLLQPILDNLDDHLRESNRIVSHDDSGTASEIVKLIHETSERDTSDTQALLWRFRRIITVENARQAFQELGGNERGQYRLTDAIIKWEPVLRNVKELPVLVNMVNELVSAWKRNKELKASKNQRISAARTRCSRNPDAYQVFIRVWNELRHLLATRGVRFSSGDAGKVEKHALEANSDFPLAALLPHKGPWGRCIIGLVQLLVDAHNAVMEASGIELDEVDLPNVDAASVIEFDPDEDLLPMLLANCTYSLRKGEGCQVAYNFHGLEQQLLERLVRGRVRIVGFLQEMVYKEEFNLLEFFEQLERVVPQAKEVKDSQTQNALNRRLATPVITALLDESLKVVVNFLISVRSKLDPQMLLHEFMTSSLRMEDGLPSESLRRHVTVEHIRLLWLSLDHHLWQHLADDGFEPSKFDGSEPLSPELKNALPTDLRDQRSILMEKLHALVKLEMRSQPRVREMPLNEISVCYPGYEVFDDWHESLYCKHAGEIWMHLHQLALE